MIGVTDDHEFKTRDGWKKFDEIDIGKDELYCWYFDIPTYDCDQTDVGEIWYNYNTIKNQYDEYIEVPTKSYIQPVRKRCFALNDSIDLFHIKNDYIDVTLSQKYILPTIYIDECDRYGNYCELDTIEEIYKKALKWDSNNNTDLCVCALSEKLMENSEYDDYTINKLAFKIEPSHFTKIKYSDNSKSIVSFELPELIEKDATWRIYARRNGKEFWI